MTRLVLEDVPRGVNFVDIDNVGRVPYFVLSVIVIKI